MSRPGYHYRLLHLSLGLAVVQTQGIALAQMQPDAGRLLEQNRAAPEPPATRSPDVRSEEPAPTARGDGTRIPVARLRITGSTRFAESEMQALVADAEGRELTLDELRRLAGRITRYYREHGYLLARAYLPAQTVRDGIVEIAVVEGRLGTIAVENRGKLRGAALAPLSQLQAGDPAHGGMLERNLLLLSDLPGASVHATLRPGAVAGTTDLLVDVEPGQRVSGSVVADNFGDRFSGRHRLGGNVQYNNPFRLGDQGNLRAIASDGGLGYLHAAYQLPISARGTRVGLAGSWMHYALGKELAPLDAGGEARTVSFHVLQPLVRSRSFNLNVQLQFDHLDLRDRIESASVTIDKRLNRWTTGLAGDATAPLGGNAANRFLLTYTGGRLELDPESRALDAVTAETAGEYGKLNLSWQRLQRLSDSNSLYASITGQFAAKNLNSSEKLWLGGPNAVRAYPQGEAAGDEGYLISLETRHRLRTDWPGQWQLAIFLDHGQVRVNKRPWILAVNSRTLTGAGVGLNFSHAPHWGIQTSLAWRTGNSAPISDSDRRPRFWLQAVRYF